MTLFGVMFSTTWKHLLTYCGTQDAPEEGYPLVWALTPPEGCTYYSCHAVHRINSVMAHSLTHNHLLARHDSWA